MYTTGEDRPNREQLQVFKAWGVDAEKVPSKISYSKASKGNKQWGYLINKDSLVMQWTKLELETRSTTDELKTLQALMTGHPAIYNYTRDYNRHKHPPEHLCKSSEEIIRDYLRKVIKEWHESVMKNSKFALDRVPVDIVITHPVVRIGSCLWVRIR
jgi:hypothetical protein